MIWLILLILALGTALALVGPLTDSNKKPVLILVLMGGVVASSLGLYALLGTPSPPPPQPQATTQMPDINAMVEGLAERLKSDPDNPQGWARLIRSRIVLGDMDAIIRDHKAMSAHYADQPNIIAEINRQSGFNEFTASLEN